MRDSFSVKCTTKIFRLWDSVRARFARPNYYRANRSPTFLILPTESTYSVNHSLWRRILCSHGVVCVMISKEISMELGVTTMSNPSSMGDFSGLWHKLKKEIKISPEQEAYIPKYEFKIFLRKRDRHELLLQRSRTLFSNLLKERPLAISGTFVMFGFNVQVVASDMQAKKTAADGKPQYGLALSSLVSERQVDFMQNINDGCLMTLSPIVTPCCRNTFVILSTKDESIHGEKMNYGDEFLLRAENYGDPEAAPLYVRYTPEAVPGPADRMPVKLSATKDSNCRWTTMPLLPCDRLEGWGSPIKTGARLIIKNCVADKSLCVMNQNWMQTFFGPECGVTCRNYIDIHKRFTAENIFTLVSDVETKKMK